MPKIKRFSVILSLIVVSCQPDDGIDTGDIRDDYIGKWNCIEVVSDGDPFYTNVTITKGEQDDIIKVHNFYGMGDENFVRLTVYDNTIILNNQTVDGNTFTGGNGTSSTNYSTFNLNYTVSTAGDIDNVTSTYTK